MDSQTVEIIGRNRLVNELLAAGLEVATPLRDRGIDLIAYVDLDEAIGRFAAFPIQL
jgi:predicted methyltransferase MtxX (methanogen marker protein 4)